LALYKIEFDNEQYNHYTINHSSSVIRHSMSHPTTPLPTKYECMRASVHAADAATTCRANFECFNAASKLFAVVYVCMQTDDAATFDCILYTRDASADAARRVDSRTDGESFADIAHLNAFLTERGMPAFNTRNVRRPRIAADAIESVPVADIHHVIYTRNRKSVETAPADAEAGVAAVSAFMYRFFALIDPEDGVADQPAA
jgi:hypothetical protein